MLDKSNDQGANLVTTYEMNLSVSLDVKNNLSLMSSISARNIKKEFDEKAITFIFQV